MNHRAAGQAVEAGGRLRPRPSSCYLRSATQEAAATKGLPAGAQTYNIRSTSQNHSFGNHLFHYTNRKTPILLSSGKIKKRSLDQNLFRRFQVSVASLRMSRCRLGGVRDSAATVDKDGLMQQTDGFTRNSHQQSSCSCRLLPCLLTPPFSTIHETTAGSQNT